MIMAVKETGVSYYGLCYPEHARKDFEEMIAHNCNAVILALTEFDIDFWFPKHYWDYESCQGTGNEGLSGYLGNNHVSITALALHVLRDLISRHVMLFDATKYTLQGFHVFRDMHWDRQREHCDEFCLPDVTVVPDMASNVWNFVVLWRENALKRHSGDRLNFRLESTEEHISRIAKKQGAVL